MGTGTSSMNRYCNNKGSQQVEIFLNGTANLNAVMASKWSCLNADFISTFLVHIHFPGAVGIEHLAPFDSNRLSKYLLGF